MIKRTIEISRDPAHLSLRLGQLVLEREHQPVATIPCEDLGMVVVDHPQVSYTHSALAALVEHGLLLQKSVKSDRSIDRQWIQNFTRIPAEQIAG